MKGTLPLVSLEWRDFGAGQPLPVITRKLEHVAESIKTHCFTNRPQHPPIGLFERLFSSCDAPAKMDAAFGRANAWAWIGGIDDCSPQPGGGFRRTSEWIGYPPEFARAVFPSASRGGRLSVNPKKVLLPGQEGTVGAMIGRRAFALSDGHWVGVAEFADGKGCFVSDDPELVLADSRGELFQIAASLSR